MPVRPHLISVLITVAWLAMMALLVRDHILPRPIGEDAEELHGEDLLAGWHNINDFMVIRRGAHVLGGNHLRAVRLREGGHHVAQRMQMRIGPAGLGPTIQLDAAAELDERLRLERFWAQLRTAGLPMTARGAVVGEDLIFDLHGPGLPGETFRQPVGEGLSLLEIVRPALYETIELEPGRSYRIPSARLFSGLSFGDLVVEVRDFTIVETSHGGIPGYEVVTSFGGIETTAWIDEMGNLILSELWGDLVLERIPHDVFSERWPRLAETLEVPVFELGAATEATLWGEAAPTLFSIEQMAQGSRQ